MIESVRDGSEGCLRLDDQLCFALYTASAAVLRTYRPLLVELGLTYQQYVVLMALWETDEATIGALAGRLRLPLSGLSPVLDRLEDAGLCERRRARHDRRVIHIALTDSGRDLEERAASVAAQVRCRTGLSSDAVAQLRDHLQALTATLATAGHL